MSDRVAQIEVFLTACFSLCHPQRCRAMRDPTPLAAAAFDKLVAAGLSLPDIHELTNRLRAKVADSDDPTEVLALLEAEIQRRDIERN